MVRFERESNSYMYKSCTTDLMSKCMCENSDLISACVKAVGVIYKYKLATNLAGYTIVTLQTTSNHFTFILI